MSMPSSIEPAHETAARHLVERVPTARGDETVAALIERMRSNRHEHADSVYVLDRDGCLQGAVGFAQLLGAQPDQPLAQLMERDLPSVGPGADQEQAALLALRHRMTAVPVVDRGGVLLGVVPALALLQILHREHIEDLHRLAGIAREDAIARGSIESPPTRRARDRLPWLIVGLCGSMLAAYVMSRYERVLAAHLAVSFFVPAIVYLADAIGTQTEAIVVRGLSIARLPLRRLLFAELWTGLLIGGTLGALALPFIGIAFGDFRLAASVAIAILLAGSAATTIGLMLPWFLQRSGKDPAFGSGPLATVIQDVLSLLIYFAVATTLVQP
jgi:magnesium transporter